MNYCVNKFITRQLIIVKIEPLQEAIPEAVYSTEIIITPLITQALQSCA